MDASLPSWVRLVERLEQLLLRESELDDFRLYASEDLQRRAEQLIYLKKKNSSLAPALYQALYEGDENSPGLLAQALARVVASAPIDVEIITTNFDDMLEKALALEGIVGQSYSLRGTRREGEDAPNDDVQSWKELNPTDRSRAVLHLHGMVTRATTRDPLILDEASFFAYGREIQDLLSNRFKDATVLLVGLSMTDPNVVAPLRATRDESHGGNRYLLTVPAIPRESNARQDEVESSARFAVKNAQLFGEDLRVHTLMVKSYGQLIQLTSDLSLDIADPAKATGARYGVRFGDALKELYKSLGYSPRSGLPRNFAKAQSLSLLMRQVSKAKGGPEYVLGQLRRKYEGECASEEQFGVFLWLRELGGTSLSANYEARLVAASTYVHWDGWSGAIVEPIAGRSRYSPASALYYGRPSSRNISPGQRGSWRGSFAVPLVQYGAKSLAQTPARSWLDQLTLGAVAINSTKCVVADEDMDVEDRSIISVISRRELDELQEAIETFEERVFSGVSSL